MDQVSQVQYFSRDICAPLSKENAYLYYVAECENREPFQAFAKRVSFEEVSEKTIVENLKNKIKSTSSISSLARLWKTLDDVREVYPQSLIRNLPRYLPEYKVSTHDMCGTNFSKVDRIIVWEMNKISPVLTGYYFEAMLSRCLGIKTKPDKDILKTRDAIITQEEFDKMIKRRGIDEDSILYESIIAYLHLNDFTEDISCAITDMKDYIDKNKQELTEYMTNLSNTWIVSTMKKEMSLQHSKYVEDEKLGIRGEMDFVSNTYITDCKCYKQDDLKSWAAQLYLYRKLVGNNVLKLRIINFNSNTVYDFTITKEFKDTSATEDEDSDEYDSDLDDV